MLALAAPLASAAPLRFSYNFLLPPHSPVIPAHLKFPYRFCPPTRPAPASAQPSFCAGFAAQKLLIRSELAGKLSRVGKSMLANPEQALSFRIRSLLRRSNRVHSRLFSA